MDSTERIAQNENLSLRKLGWEVRKLRIEVILLALAAVYAVLFSFGAVLIFSYFYRYDFNSGGISASDTVPMTLVSFGFVIITFILLGIATYIAYPIPRAILWARWRWLDYKISKLKRTEDGGIDCVGLSKFDMPTQFDWKAKDRIALALGSIGLLLTLWALCVGPPSLLILVIPMLGAGAWISFFLFGSFKELYCGLPRRELKGGIDGWLHSLSMPRRNLVILVFITSSLLLFAIPPLEDLTFTAVGFRKQNVSVRLTKDDFKQMMSDATRVGISVNPCERIDDGAFVLNRADVVWQRLGTQALVRLPTQPIGADRSNPQANARIEPSNANLSFVEKRGVALKCEEFLSDFLFKADGVTLSPNVGARLERDLKWLQDDLDGWVVRIVAHGESPAGPDQNAPVSRNLRQATSIRDYLVTAYGLPARYIVIVDAAMSEPKRTCRDEAGLALKLCERMNRRIEISRYSPDDPIAVQ